MPCAAGLIWGNKHPEGITFHTIKHTDASRLRNHGIPDALIKYTIGWESHSMVDHYIPSNETMAPLGPIGWPDSNAREAVMFAAFRQGLDG